MRLLLRFRSGEVGKNGILAAVVRLLTFAGYWAQVYNGSKEHDTTSNRVPIQKVG